MNGIGLGWYLLQDVLWSGLAALGFALVFNVPRRALLGCVAAGAIGHSVRSLLMTMDVNIIPATLAGAVAIGFWGDFWARRWRIPAAVFNVSGAIPMVPGSLAFKAMLSILSVATTTTSSFLLETRLAEAGSSAITTALVLGALAVGIAAPALLFQRTRPVV
ncbi:MAG: threonine/serine exporter family protein [Ardenticatenaceae bacterium]|nr:threonine/serine exporter family protein [Anaerolineales bacterium]MCB8919032.1 threonine/serine exporter family protein [Ardenticatenaceae bacterium]